MNDKSFKRLFWIVFGVLVVFAIVVLILIKIEYGKVSQQSNCQLKENATCFFNV